MQGPACWRHSTSSTAPCCGCDAHYYAFLGDAEPGSDVLHIFVLLTKASSVLHQYEELNLHTGSESPVKEGRAAASSGQHHESHLETEGGNGVAPKVNAKEEDIYTSILGAENVFSIKVIT